MNPDGIENNEQEKFNKVESKDKFGKIKSKYILKQIFDNIQKKKSLEIIKYNKMIQNRMDINMNNYKEYSEIYSSIEIEIIPAKNKTGQFINLKKEEEIFYHVYFDDNKEEIKRNILNEGDKVSKIKIIIDYQIKSFVYLFYLCPSIESIYFKKIYRNNINNMSHMFEESPSIKEISFNNSNAKDVTSMNNMFRYCSSLKRLNFNNFFTNKLNDMSYMFYHCSNLKNLNLSSFDTSKVSKMDCMFYGCS